MTYVHSKVHKNYIEACEKFNCEIPVILVCEFGTKIMSQLNHKSYKVSSSHLLGTSCNRRIQQML